MLNLGAITDLSENWFAEENNDVRCYVIDHHRPIHHNNIYSRKKIILIDEGNCRIESCPAPEDLEHIDTDEDEDYYSENSDFDDEIKLKQESDYTKKEEPKEEEEIVLGRKRKARRLNERKLLKKLKVDRGNSQ